METVWGGHDSVSQHLGDWVERCDRAQMDSAMDVRCNDHPHRERIPSPGDEMTDTKASSYTNQAGLMSVSPGKRN